MTPKTATSKFLKFKWSYPPIFLTKIVKAFCVLKPGHQGDASMVKTLQDHVKAQLAPYKYPRKVVFVAQLPRTETGKLQRFKLKASS